MNQTPIPHDIGLQLPINVTFLHIVLVFVFLLHILFVNFMVAGTTFAFIFQVIGLFKKKYDKLAYEISSTVTVNKSLAIVLGVGPLLAINLGYTLYFYSSTALTGIAWLMVIPLVTLAFLLTYLHKYTWEKLENHKLFSIAIGFTSTVLFWLIPFIFLANVNLMLFPSQWPKVSGFLSSLLIPNVIPRYFHFMTATMAVTSLFAVGWFGRKKYNLKENLAGFTKAEIKKLFYSIAFITTCFQFFIGPLTLLTLPVHGISLNVYLFFIFGLLFAILFMILVWRELRSEKALLGKHFWGIIILLTVTVICMGFGRHEYRERAVTPHRMLVEQKTQNFYWQAEAAQTRERLGISTAPKKSPGEAAFETNCSVCHAKESVLVGPSLVEINEIYQDYPEGIVEWSKAPEVKRGGPVMPPFKHLGDETLLEIANYMLSALDEQE